MPPSAQGLGLSHTIGYLLNAEFRLQVPLVHDCRLRASGCKEAAAPLLPFVDCLVPGDGPGAGTGLCQRHGLGQRITYPHSSTLQLLTAP